MSQRPAPEAPARLTRWEQRAEVPLFGASLLFLAGYAVRVCQAVQRRQDRPRLSLYGRVMTYAGLTAVLLGSSAALAVYHLEHRAPDASIRTFGDAVWWACETLTTVGYGDTTPVTF